MRLYDVLVSLMGLLITVSLCVGASSKSASAAETQYLMFQMFSVATNPSQAMGATVVLKDIPDRSAMSAFVESLKDHIGSTGTKDRKLGFVIGPLALDHSDSQVQQLIRDGFAVAQSHDIAVAFHLDDSMFWTQHPALQNGNDYIEWTDWAGTKNTGRRVDWGPSPTKLAPQLCFNSQPVTKAVKERAALIGAEVTRGYQTLKVEGREYLFAGVIAGWETMLAQDFDTGLSTGYCALTQEGYSAAHPPQNLAAARDAVVKDFITLWTSSLQNAGVPKNRLYNHIAYTTQGLSGNASDQPGGEVAFDAEWRPGFSTYPAPGALSEILALLVKHNRPAWASVEGANVIPNGMQGEPTMETYLGRMFNRGATLVNIFAWGVGPRDKQRNPFYLPTEGPDAIAGYRAFLDGKLLHEVPAEPFSLIAFQQQLQLLQQRLPGWVQRTKRMEDSEKMMRKIDKLIHAGDLPSANAAVSAALEVVQH